MICSLMSTYFGTYRCILSEMWTRRVLFQGRSDPDQLKVIFDSCGTPDQSYLRYDTILQHKEVINDNQGADSRKVIPVTEIATPPRKRVLRDDSRYHQYVEWHLGCIALLTDFHTVLSKSLRICSTSSCSLIPANESLRLRRWKTGTSGWRLAHYLEMSEFGPLLVSLWSSCGGFCRVKHLAASKERRDQQEEAEAHERTREVERVQHAHAANIQAMATSAAMHNMPPRVQMQQPIAQLPPHQFPAQANNPYAQPGTFYPNQAPMMNPPMQPISMPYNSNVGPPPGVPMNPYAPPPNASAFPPVPMSRPPHMDMRQDAMGMPPQAQQRPANNFGGNRQHGMPSNGGFQPRPSGLPFKPKFKGNFQGPQGPQPAASQEQPKNPRPVNPDRFG